MYAKYLGLLALLATSAFAIPADGQSSPDTNTNTNTNTDTNTATNTATRTNDSPSPNPTTTTINPSTTTTLKNCDPGAKRGYIEIMAAANTYIQGTDLSYSGGTKDDSAKWSRWFFYKTKSEDNWLEKFNVFEFEDGKMKGDPKAQCTLTRPKEDITTCIPYDIDWKTVAGTGGMYLNCKPLKG